MDDLSDFLADVWDDCVANGMTLPFIICCAAANGAIQVYRFRGLGTGIEELAVHSEPDAIMVLPINIMIVDKGGNATRVLIDAERIKTFH